MSVLSRFKKAAGWGLLRSGALALHSAVAQRGRAVVLMYHRVNDDDDPFFPSMPSSVFEAQLDFLRRHYRIGGLEETVAWLRSGAEGPARVVLTIDDGYPDTHDVVLPALKRRGLPATLFLTTAPLETGELLWLDRMRALVKLTASPVLHSARLGLGPWPLSSTPDRLKVMGRLRSFLKTKDAASIEDTVGELGELLGEAEVVPRAPKALTWTQVGEMLRGGITLGAHTHRHYIMSRLSPGEARAEVETSVDLIRRRTGAPPTTFAYPNGAAEDYTPANRALLAELGMTCVCTTVFGFAHPGGDPLDLPRLHTTAPSLGLFACRVAGLNRSRPETRTRVVPPTLTAGREAR